MDKAYTSKEYSKYVEQKSPASPILKDTLWAFFVGGAICLIGEFLAGQMELMGLDSLTAGAWVSIALIFTSALLTGLGIYDKLAKRAGAGTLVPITGFANAIVATAIEFKKEGYITGLGAKMFTIAGPVIVFGVISSVFVGLIYCLF